MAESSNAGAEQPVAGALERAVHRLESLPRETIETQHTERSPVAAVPAAAAVASPSFAGPVVVAKTPLREDIEDALAEGLRAAYAALTPGQQAAFRQHGERLAAMLEAMVVSGKIDIGRAHRGIVAWLRLIPKVNRFFLTQEAKVKTDAIVALAQRSRS